MKIGWRSGVAAFVLALVLAMESTLMPASAQRGDLEAIFARMRDLSVAGNEEAALVEAQKFEALVKARFGTDHPYYAAALNALGIVYNHLGA